MSGTIAAAANQGGVVGVAYRARLMTVKVLDDRGRGNTRKVAEGIRYAAANGARIINLSVDSPDDDPRVRAAVKAAAAADVLIVCSAGNGGTDLDRTRLYPVSIPAPNLIGVAATGQANQYALESFSNYGRLTVPVAAPGAEVVSTSRTGGYESKSGTSMAAPHVTGVAALMAAAAPQLTAPGLRALLLETPSTPTRRSAPGSWTRSARCSPPPARPASSSAGRRGARVLLATRRGRVMRVQVALRGATQAVHRLVVRLDGRFVIRARGGRRVLTIAWRGRAGRRVSVAALAADGRTLATAAARVDGGAAMTRARRRWRLLWLGTSATLLLTPSPAAAAAARTITRIARLMGPHGRAADRARDPRRQPPLPRRGGRVLRRQVGHLVRRDRPPAGARQDHQAARPAARARTRARSRSAPARATSA